MEILILSISYTNICPSWYNNIIQVSRGNSTFNVYCSVYSTSFEQKDKFHIENAYNICIFVKNKKYELVFAKICFPAFLDNFSPRKKLFFG